MIKRNKKGYWLGKKRSQETKDKIRKSLTGFKHSEETRKKLSEIQAGEGNGFYGKHHTNETIKKLKQKLKGRVSPRGMLGKKQTLIHKQSISGKNNWNWKGGISSAKNYKRKKKMEYLGRKIDALGEHTVNDWEDLKKKYGYMCLCCKKHEPEIKLTEDHIIPLSNGGSDKIDNIQPLCGICNSRKHTKIIDYIMSNNSEDGLWDEHINLTEWNKKYKDIGNYPVLFYRFRAV